MNWALEQRYAAAAAAAKRIVFWVASDLTAVGSRAHTQILQLLIEDTHTSIDMFRHGWGSRYVNEPGNREK